MRTRVADFGIFSCDIKHMNRVAAPKGDSGLQT
jgi:hypothetical protein